MAILTDTIRSRHRRRPALPIALGLLVLLARPAVRAQTPAASPEPTPAKPQVIVNDLSWPPYYLGGQPDRPKGFAKEVLELCIPETGFTPHFVPYPIPRMYPMLENGTLDVHIVSHRPEREAYLAYGTEPVFHSSYRPVVRVGSGIEIHSIEDFDPLRLGHISGLKYTEAFLDYVERRDKEGHLETVTQEEIALRMLVAGRIDVYVGSPPGARWVAQEMGIGDRIEVLDFDLRTRPYYVVVSKRSANVHDPVAFHDAVDRCLREIKSDGRYAEIARRYGVDETGPPAADQSPDD